MPSAMVNDGDSVIITPSREAGKLENNHASPVKGGVTAGGPNISRTALFDASNTSDINLGGTVDPQDTRMRGSVEMASQ